MGVFREFTCDACGGSEHIPLFEKEGFKHVRCRDCGMVFVNPRLDSHIDGQMLSGTGSMGDDSLTGSQIRRIQKELDRIERYRKLNRIIEIGAGRGWFLAEASGRGWETWAVEINYDALEKLRNKCIDRIIEEPAEDFHCSPDSFDVVRMWDVIEHLGSPWSALKRIHEVLRVGGLLYLSTTNFASLSRWVNGPEWVYLNGADHIQLFEPRTITRLLIQTGFTSVSIRTRSFNLRRKLYHPENELQNPYWWLRPFRKLIDESIRFTRYGHQMIVTAVKTKCL